MLHLSRTCGAKRIHTSPKALMDTFLCIQWYIPQMLRVCKCILEPVVLIFIVTTFSWTAEGAALGTPP